MQEIKFQHIFGPVPSRRLGTSLGIDVVPYKTCNFNCIYCECGKTTNLINERKSFFDYNKIIEEVDFFLKNCETEIDYITFSGAGEPLLNKDFEKILEFLKRKYPSYKIALITNGSFLYKDEIIEEIKDLDLILPSLDAGCEETFKKVNRPHKEVKFENLIYGLTNIREKFKGEIWLETFFVKNINDNDEELEKMKKIIEKINPDKIQINTIDRPPALSKAMPLKRERLIYIKEKFGKKAEIISRQNIKKTVINENNLEIVKNCLLRRPLTLEDILKTTGISVNEINKILSIIKPEEIKINGKIFFKIKKEPS